MKAAFITLFAIASSLYATAQNAVKDLSITGTYNLATVAALGKVHVTPTIANESKSDYKDITYKVEFVAGDGTAEGSENVTWHDFIGPGTSKKIKGSYFKCPKDCKSVNLTIVSGNKLD